MKTGEAALADPLQGIVRDHIPLIEAVARDRDEVIMFRGVSPWATPLIENGHPTKGFHVKGKSSDWGPHAGMIPFNAEMSKVKTADDRAKYNGYNLKSIADGYARSEQLVLTAEDVRRLTANPGRGSPARKALDGAIVPSPKLKGVLYMKSTRPVDNASFTFVATPVTGGHAVSVFATATWEPHAAGRSAPAILDGELKLAVPLKVLYDPGTPKPLAADYDLFAICPSFGRYDHRDRKTNPILADPAHKARLAMYEKNAAARGNSTQLNTLKNTPILDEDKEMGNVTQRIVEVIHALNGKIGMPKKVHHNADSGNPGTEMKDNFPVTAIQPRSLSRAPGTVILLESEAEVINYFRSIILDGYYPPRNPKWSNFRSFLKDIVARNRSL